MIGAPACAVTARVAPGRAQGGGNSIAFVPARDGLMFRDERVGNGPEVYAGDAVVVVFTARVLDASGDAERRRMGESFDPFVVGGAGASASKGARDDRGGARGETDARRGGVGFKLEIGSPTNDIIVGWERGFEGDGVMPRMRIGGKRTLRIPPALAYGDAGHHCRDGIKGACEVNPGESVEIQFEILRYT